MTLPRRLFCLLLLLAPVAALPALATPTDDADVETPAPRAAADILADYRSLLPPHVDPQRMQEPDYMAEYQRAFEEVIARQTRLIHELSLADPDNEQLADLLKLLWARTGMGEVAIPGYDPVSHMRSYLEQHPDGPAAKEARLYLPLSRLYGITSLDDPDSREQRAKAFDEIDAYLAKHKDDEIVSKLRLVWMKLRYVSPEETEQLARIYRQIPELAPNTKQARWAAGQLRRITEIGQPFELKNRDLVSGEEISIDDYRGKIVAVIFWATHSGPSQTQVPRWKRLLEQYQSQEVAFIGVPLETNEERVRSYCDSNSIAWPQLWLGAEAEAFAESWGIHGVPTIFLIDHEGRLAGTRGSDNLEAQLQELLAQRDDAEQE